jgi:hypothetical protein
MPACARIAAAIAALALAAPSVALGQGGDPGAGDSQYQDPFGASTTQSQPASPAHTPDQQDRDDDLGVAEPDIRTTPAPPQSGAGGDGVDVLPVAGGVALALVLLLVGLALRRRPHAHG